MRHLSLVILCVVALATTALAQPKYGDLILTVSHSGWLGGYTCYVDPATPGAPTTLAPAAANFIHNWVRMAPDNASLVVSETSSTRWDICHLIELAPGGIRATLVANIDSVDGFALDHDDHWVVTSRDYAASPRENFLLRVGHSTPSVTTIAALPSPTVTFNAVAIDRDPGAPVYVVGCWEPATSILVSPKLLGVDGRGNLSTIVGGSGDPLRDLTGVELDPLSGDYLTLDFASPEVMRVDKAGNATPVTIFAGPNAAKFGQDGHAWVAGMRSFWILRYDLANNTMVSVFQLGLQATDRITGLEVYGSRPLVCNQPTGTSTSPVTVNVHSRHPQAGGASFILAASVARRPGLRFANGEWLHLDVSHPLFYTSALGLAPGIFTNFQGQLNASGSTTATVNIPPGLPPLDDMPIFVAGVIFEGANIIQVTNTHWFVL